MIKRSINLEELVKKGKVLIVYGPRRVGKTTLLQDYLKTTKLKYKWSTGDDIVTQQVLGSQNLKEILEYYNGYDLAAIDEAQNIKNLGMGLKILVDNNPEISVIMTGSSSFNIEQETGEPLTGRKRSVSLYPISQQELYRRFNKFELQEKLEDFLVFGSYPEVVLANSRKEKIEILTELVNSYLLKDVFALASIKGSRTFIDLLKLLAFQVGSEVSIHELGVQIGIESRTIQRYIDLLEKSFVIRRLTPYSTNLRKEITSKNKYYFLDNGVRNRLIAQFNKLSERDDVGKLFENFTIMERIKQIANNGWYRNLYFWRTYDGQEIDLIEEYDGKLFPIEIKWNENAKYKLSALWSGKYKSEELKIINRKNYLDVLLKQENEVGS